MGKSLRHIIAERRVEDGLMALIHGQLQRFFGSLPRAHGGVVNTGTHDPTDGTHEARIGATAAIIGDEGDQPIDVSKIPAAMPYGIQYGHRGNERVVLNDAPTESGFISHTHYGADDSPGAPSGELWLFHRNGNGTPGDIDAYQKFTNDGVAAGDGKGGIVELAGAYRKIATAGGWVVTLDDTGKIGKIQSPGGLSIILDDNNGTITLGSGDDPGAADALIRKSDLDNALSAQMNQLKTDLTTWASTHLQPGSGGTGPTSLTAVTSSGSAKVQSA